MLGALSYIERVLNLHKTFRRRPVPPSKVLYMFNLRPGSRGNYLMQQVILRYSLYLMKNLIFLKLVTAAALKREVMVSD